MKIPLFPRPPRAPGVRIYRTESWSSSRENPGESQRGRNPEFQPGERGDGSSGEDQIPTTSHFLGFPTSPGSLPGFVWNFWEIHPFFPCFSLFQPLPWKSGAFPAPGFTSRGLGLAKPVVFRDKLGFLGFADVLKGSGRSWLKEGLEFGSQQLRADIPMDRNS